MEEKSPILVEPQSARCDKRVMAILLAIIVLVSLFALQAIQVLMWDGGFSFKVHVESEKRICWMEACELWRPILAEDYDVPSLTQEQIIHIMWQDKPRRQSIDLLEKPFRVEVSASGHERTILFWTWETRYSRRPYFALYGLFEDGEYFAKIVPTPKERDFRGTVVVELP